MLDQNSEKKNHPFHFRYFLLILFVSFIFAIFYVRAFILAFATPLPTFMQDERMPIRRGTIFDSKKHELALSLNSISVALKPSELPADSNERSKTLQLLAQQLGMPLAEIQDKIASHQPFVWLKRQMNDDDIDNLSQIQLPGVILREEPSRKYPNKNLASSVIGFVGVDNEGLAGIEYQFNDVLTAAHRKKSIKGNNIVLTLNAFIQFHLEKTLRSALKDTGSKSAIGIITEVKTGRILAMSSLPDFDPNAPQESSESSKSNRAVTTFFEPGSTFKMFTLASLFKENLADENQKYCCPGIFKEGIIENTCPGDHQKLQLRDVIKTSCNVGIIQASFQMPVTTFYKNLREFSFGSLTEIELPGEIRGVLRNPNQWDRFLKVYIPMGHGVGTTPIQLITAANAIANGGTIYKPSIIEEITSAEGDVLHRFHPVKRNQVFDRHVSEKVLSYLQSVVEKGGTGYLADIPGFKLAGKTGTSVKSDSKQYFKDRFIASFLGFFPGDKPEVSVLIIFDEPQGERHQGGNVAAPAFKNVVAEVMRIIHKGDVYPISALPQLKYQFIAPKDHSRMPNLLGRSKKEALQFIWQNFPGDHKIYGSGYLLKQVPAPNAPLGKIPYQFELYFGFGKSSKTLQDGP